MATPCFASPLLPPICLTLAGLLTITGGAGGARASGKRHAPHGHRGYAPSVLQEVPVLEAPEDPPLQVLTPPLGMVLLIHSPSPCQSASSPLGRLSRN